MNTLQRTLLSTVLLTAVSSANALIIDGVEFTPGVSNSFDTVNSLYATDVTGIGSVVSGIGQIVLINNSSFGSSELTYVFDNYVVSAFDGLNFEATGGTVKIYVDAANNYASTIATAEDGDLWLDLIGNSTVIGGVTLTGTIAEANTQGGAFGLLDVIGGSALVNFDNNTALNGADASFNASYSDSAFTTVDGFTKVGSSDLHATAISEPGTLALLGLGILGVCFQSRRKQQQS